MIRNFLVTSEICVETNGVRFDLHNDFEFMGFRFDAVMSVLSLKWQEVNSKDRKFLAIDFVDLKYLALDGLDADMPRKEDKTLSFIGYLHQDSPEVMDGFLPEEMASPTHHLIIKFLGGLTIKVFSASALITTSSNGSMQ